MMKGRLISFVLLFLLFGMSGSEKSTSSELSADAMVELTGYLETISQGWDQTAVDSANAILSNASYDFDAWEDFFSEYFSNNSFTDDLRSYLGYPVFWWFSYEAHYNLQEGLINPLINNTEGIIKTYEGNLSDSLSSDTNLLQTLMNSLRFLNDMVRPFAVINETSKNRIFNFYKGLVNTYPNFLKKEVTFNVGSEPYLATVRAQVYANLRDTLPLTLEIKSETAQTINLTQLHLNTWNDFSVLVCDNNGFDIKQLDVIYDTLKEIPLNLHNLGIVTQNDLLGNTGEKYQWLAVESGINIFDIKVGSITENGFPNDVTPKYSDVFSIVLIHEINHVVDAWWISNSNTLDNRKMDLIEAAGNISMNYLRSMFTDDFFTMYPQEFFASISNQWFSDTLHTLELGLTRFSNGYTEPINQFLFFADIYSAGGNQTLFYTLDVEGNITKTIIPLTRDANGHINSLYFNRTRYCFTLDQQGNVLGFNSTPCSVSSIESKLVDAPVDKVYFLYADPVFMTRPEAAYDMISGGIVYGLCANIQHQGFNTTKDWLLDTGAINATTIRNATIAMFGGTFPHASVRFYVEDAELTPIKEGWNSTHFWFENRTGNRVASLSWATVAAGHEDFFVIEVFTECNNTFLFIYGVDWRGTWAGGIYFKEVMVENLSDYEKQYYIYHWVDDSDQDSIPQSPEITMTSSG